MSIFTRNPDPTTIGNSFLSLGTNILNGTPITCSCWIKPLKFEGAIIVIAGNTSTTNCIRMSMDSNGYIAARVNDVANNAVSTAPVKLGVWNHICVVFSSTTLRAAFVNGGNKGTATTTINSTSTGQARIGSAGTTASGINALIAEVGLWNVALTDNEVRQLALGTRPDRVRFNNLKYYASFKVNAPRVSLFAEFINKIYTERYNSSTSSRPTLDQDHPDIIIDAEFSEIDLALPATTFPERTAVLDKTEDNDTISSSSTINIASVSNITESNDTINSASTISISSILNKTESNDTISSATTNALSVVLNKTEDNDTISSASTVAINTICNITEGNDTVSGLLDITQTGLNLVSNITEANDTVSFTTTNATNVVLNKTESNDTINSTSTININSILNKTESNDTISGAFTNALSVILNKTESPDTINSTSTISISSILNKSESNDILSGVSTNLISTNSNITESSDTLSGLLDITQTGSSFVANITEASDSISSISNIDISSALTKTESDDSVSGIVDVSINAVSNITEGNDTSSGVLDIAITLASSIQEASDSVLSVVTNLIKTNLTKLEASDTLLSFATTVADPPFKIYMNANYTNTLTLQSECTSTVEMIARYNNKLNFNSSSEG